MFVPRISNLDNQRPQVFSSPSRRHIITGSQHYHINYSVYDTYDTNYSSTSSSTISLRLIIAYPVAFLVFDTKFTIYCSIRSTSLRVTCTGSTSSSLVVFEHAYSTCIVSVHTYQTQSAHSPRLCSSDRNESPCRSLIRPLPVQ